MACTVVFLIIILFLDSFFFQGVTLLAIGNGAPDIFSALAAFNHPDPKKSSLAFGALFGMQFLICYLIIFVFRPSNCLSLYTAIMHAS